MSDTVSPGAGQAHVSFHDIDVSYHHEGCAWQRTVEVCGCPASAEKEKVMKTARNLCTFILAALLCAAACAATAEAAVPFIRIDRDDPLAWQGELDNVRLLKDDLFAF